MLLVHTTCNAGSFDCDSPLNAAKSMELSRFCAGAQDQIDYFDQSIKSVQGTQADYLVKEFRLCKGRLQDLYQSRCQSRKDISLNKDSKHLHDEKSPPKSKQEKTIDFSSLFNSHEKVEDAPFEDNPNSIKGHNGDKPQQFENSNHSDASNYCVKDNTKLDSEHYANKSCSYFTKPLIMKDQDGEPYGLNRYSEGANVCYRCTWYECDSSRWTVKGKCQNWMIKMDASVIEGD